MRDIIFLSEKEKQLLELLETCEYKVTVKIIEEKLSKQHIGALGKLLGYNLIEKKKEAQAGQKATVYYVTKEENVTLQNEIDNAENHINNEEPTQNIQEN